MGSISERLVQPFWDYEVITLAKQRNSNKYFHKNCPVDRRVASTGVAKLCKIHRPKAWYPRRNRGW
jgi:hypothetical protein